MNFIKKIKINKRKFSIFKKKEPVKLGRWNIDYDKTGIKSDYATHDSCGGELCGNPPKNKNIEDKINDNSENDLMLYSLIGTYHINTKKKK